MNETANSRQKRELFGTDEQRQGDGTPSEMASNMEIAMDTEATTDVEYDGSSDLANISDAELEALMLASSPNRLAKSTPAQVAKDEAKAKLMMQRELKSPEGRKLICETAFSGEVLRSMLSRGGGWASKHCVTECVAVDYAEDISKDIADPIERMIVVQILWAHARSGMLSQLAAQQTEVESAEAMHNLAGRASSLFAKLVNALDQHRQASQPSAPQAAPGSATASLSITVQHKEKRRNKKGCREGRKARESGYFWLIDRCDEMMGEPNCCRQK